MHRAMLTAMPGTSDPRHIALIAPPWYPVPPCGYGGIENVVAVLADELRLRGHRVTVFGAAGSGPDTIIHAPEAWRTDLGGPDERLRELTYAARVLGDLTSVGADVIHDHVGYATLLGAVSLGTCPVLHSVHGVLASAHRTFLRALGGGVALAAISRHQRVSAPDVSWAGTVLNGVPLPEHPPSSADADDPYLLCLARICADKGQHLAIEVARRTGMRLVMAGKVEPGDAGRDYFDRLVAPEIDGDRIVCCANVERREKAALLAHATALVAPIQWDEPFGLSVVEAMVMGTPAISMMRGAAPELIDHGVTGFLVEDVDAMADAVARVGDIDRAACARVARTRFSPSAMADGYLELYDRIDTGTLRASAPWGTQPMPQAMGAARAGAVEAVEAAGAEAVVVSGRASQ